MPSGAAAPISSPTLSRPSFSDGDGGRSAYLREARRLRGRFGDQPVHLQLSLLTLSRRRDSESSATQSIPRRRTAAAKNAAGRVRSEETAVCIPVRIPNRVFNSSSLAIDAFADMARREFEGPVLRCSTREMLLGSAARLGVSRFDASLVIAALQHGRGGAASERGRRLDPPTSPWWAAMFFLIVQTCVVAAIWWIAR